MGTTSDYNRLEEEHGRSVRSGRSLACHRTRTARWSQPAKRRVQADRDIWNRRFRLEAKLSYGRACVVIFDAVRPVVQSKRINENRRRVNRVCIEVRTSAKSDWTLAYESLEGRAVVPSPVEVQPGAIVFSAETTCFAAFPSYGGRFRQCFCGCFRLGPDARGDFRALTP